MSDAPQVRRADKLTSDIGVRKMLSDGYAGRLASVGPDGWPYIVPLLYV
jgi:nitroimidazol reductase NimA-like FMN-containing flavoprotein (pyridoxamine 5'-phosphate oxidase superfamily)